MKISLRKLAESDMGNYLSWMQDEGIMMIVAGTSEKFLEQDIRKSFAKMLNSEKDFHYTILLGEQSIGIASLVKDRTNQHKLQLIIGDKSCWSKGYDMEVVRQMVEIAKEKEDLKVYIEVKPSQDRTIAAFANYGFVATKNKKYPKDNHFPQSLKMELS